MNFRFNFPGSSTDDTVNSIYAEKFVRAEEDRSTVPCEYIIVHGFNLKIPSSKNLKTVKCGKFNIKCLKQNLTGDKVETLRLIDETKSDLLPGKYEGGLKVWECSIDLAQYLTEKNCIQAGDLVLELGCGVGLPGIAAYLCGGLVTFQDFNSEVLELVTAPNVLLNTPKEQQYMFAKKCQFLCGDWQSIKEKYYKEGQDIKQYDFIITSETIYEKGNYTRLLDLMKSTLRPGGTIYLASKVHYFGVGGGIHDFEELLKEDNSFEFSTVYRTEEGVQRQILKLMFRNSAK